jgi:EPS-associated MarR family transcriptional regulator
MLSDEYRYKILKALEENPEASQRELARQLGVSLGKVNYCLKSLVEVGLLKANMFRNSSNKRGYIYILTPRGIEEKAVITARFLRRKVEEYESLQEEIRRLKREVAAQNLRGDSDGP